MKNIILLSDEIFADFPFKLTLVPWTDDVAITMYDVESVHTDGITRDYVDKHIVGVYGGPLCTDSIANTKKRMKRLFESKVKANNVNWIHGATAEFFSHLLLNHCGYRQEFLFKNLEEGSIKKGFDGLYSIEDDIWLMESKSGEYSDKTNHYTKFREAWRDLQSRLGDTSNNDPWENALHHAGFLNVRSSKSILSMIRQLSDEFIDDRGRNISDFNIIPCATIFTKHNQILLEQNVVLQNIQTFLKNENHSYVHVVCITHEGINSFLSYLGLSEGIYV